MKAYRITPRGKKFVNRHEADIYTALGTEQEATGHPGLAITSGIESVAFSNFLQD